MKLGALNRIRSCLSVESRKTIVQSTILAVLDYGDFYKHTAPSILKALDKVYYSNYSAVCFATGDAFKTHHCELNEIVFSL